MGPRTPGSSSNRRRCQNTSPEKPSSINFCNPQFPQNVFSQPPYAMNFPFPPFPHYTPYSPNFQYAVPPQYAPYSLPPPSGAMPSPYLPDPVMPSKAASDQGTPHSVTGPVEQDGEPERTSGRLTWTKDEDIRLINAWLIHFKTDKYWEKVTAEYNSTTPVSRKRELQHLKGHWHKTMKKVAHFNDCWCRVKAKYHSGQSEGMQLMDKTWLMYNKEAHVMYLEEAKHNFSFEHCWQALSDQPKLKEYISSLFTKRTMRSESGDYMSSSEDSEDVPGKEIDKQVTSKEGKLKGSTSSSEVQDKCLVGSFYMLTKNNEDMTEIQPSVSHHKLALGNLKQPDTADKDTGIPINKSKLLIADASCPTEIHVGKQEPKPDTSKLNEHRQGMAVRDDMLEKESWPQGFEIIDNQRVQREELPKKESHAQGFKPRKVSRKRKGKASSSSCEVQADIKHALYLQTMLKNDREKMSEVQLRLSKEQLELARLKQEEAKEKKETTLYKKYTELLLADTSRFDEFQKAEYERAVRHIGEMLFGKDSN
ncbi:uncharacterized protein LOC102710813 [Oryza brachyantha]|uniref:No apical meristem-associated C-terminal domain-containing protein n=1 Tax=Oryza brachyantha TaxID=4533 RepID=J3MWH4_ORYBR|nr:uncharacterized protein LOC102710813 [Oryza brachyantha]